MSVTEAVEMSGPSPARRVVVVVALVATVVLALAAAIIWIRTGFRVTGGYLWLAVPITLLAALTYAGSGAVIVLRRREIHIGYVAGAAKIAGSAGGLGTESAAMSADASGAHPAGVAVLEPAMREAVRQLVREVLEEGAMDTRAQDGSRGQPQAAGRRLAAGEDAVDTPESPASQAS